MVNMMKVLQLNWYINVKHVNEGTRNKILTLNP